jgi:hypothetical protein
MKKKCKTYCNKKYNRFKTLHFKPKNEKNGAFINATESLHKKTCKRLCKKTLTKQRPPKNKTRINKKRKPHKGGGILPIPLLDSISMMKFIPSNFINSLSGFKGLASPLPTLSQFSVF